MTVAAPLPSLALAGSPGFVVSGPDDVVVEWISRRAEWIYADLSRAHGLAVVAPLPSRCHLRIEPQGDRAWGHCVVSYAGGRLADASIEIHGPTDTLPATLAHELVHLFLAHLFGRHLPLWANEGLAVLAEPESGRRNWRRLACDLRFRERLWPLHTLLRRQKSPAAERERDACYAQAASLVECLVAREGGGPPARRTLLAFLAEGATRDWYDYTNELRRHYDLIDERDLERAWHAFLDDPLTRQDARP